VDTFAFGKQVTITPLLGQCPCPSIGVALAVAIPGDCLSVEGGLILLGCGLRVSVALAVVVSCSGNDSDSWELLLERE